MLCSYESKLNPKRLAFMPICSLSAHSLCRRAAFSHSLQSTLSLWLVYAHHEENSVRIPQALQSRIHTDSTWLLFILSGSDHPERDRENNPFSQSPRMTRQVSHSTIRWWNSLAVCVCVCMCVDKYVVVLGPVFILGVFALSRELVRRLWFHRL